MGLQGDDKNQSPLKIAKLELLLDIITVTAFIDSAGLEAWGIPGGPELALVSGNGLTEGSNCTCSDKATFAFSQPLLPSALQVEPDCSPS